MIQKEGLPAGSACRKKHTRGTYAISFERTGAAHGATPVIFLQT
jgi:hypothetical protein